MLRKFVSKMNLQNPISIYLNITPQSGLLGLETVSVKCVQCPEEKQSLQELKAHISLDHLAYLPYQCAICASVFRPTDETLKLHVQETHPGQQPKMLYTPDEAKEARLNCLISQSYQAKAAEEGLNVALGHAASGNNSPNLPLNNPPLSSTPSSVSAISGISESPGIIDFYDEEELSINDNNRGDTQEISNSGICRTRSENAAQKEIATSFSPEDPPAASERRSEQTSCFNDNVQSQRPLSPLSHDVSHESLVVKPSKIRGPFRGLNPTEKDPQKGEKSKFEPLTIEVPTLDEQAATDEVERRDSESSLINVAVSQSGNEVVTPPHRATFWAPATIRSVRDVTIRLDPIIPEDHYCRLCEPDFKHPVITSPKWTPVEKYEHVLSHLRDDVDSFKKKDVSACSELFKRCFPVGDSLQRSLVGADGKCHQDLIKPETEMAPTKKLPKNRKASVCRGKRLVPVLDRLLPSKQPTYFASMTRSTNAFWSDMISSIDQCNMQSSTGGEFGAPTSTNSIGEDFPPGLIEELSIFDRAIDLLSKDVTGFDEEETVAAEVLAEVAESIKNELDSVTVPTKFPGSSLPSAEKFAESSLPSVVKLGSSPVPLTLVSSCNEQQQNFREKSRRYKGVRSLTVAVVRGKFEPLGPNLAVCHLCKGTVITNSGLHRHVIREHLNTNCVRCRCCDFATTFNMQKVQEHFRVAHPDVPEDIEDRRADFKHRIASLLKECFPSSYDPLLRNPEKPADSMEKIEPDPQLQNLDKSADTLEKKEPDAQLRNPEETADSTEKIEPDPQLQNPETPADSMEKDESNQCAISSGAKIENLTVVNESNEDEAEPTLASRKHRLSVVLSRNLISGDENSEAAKSVIGESTESKVHSLTDTVSQLKSSSAEDDSKRRERNCVPRKNFCKRTSANLVINELKQQSTKVGAVASVDAEKSVVEKADAYCMSFSPISDAVESNSDKGASLTDDEKIFDDSPCLTPAAAPVPSTNGVDALALSPLNFRPRCLSSALSHGQSTISDDRNMDSTRPGSSSSMILDTIILPELHLTSLSLESMKSISPVPSITSRGSWKKLELFTSRINAEECLITLKKGAEIENLLREIGIKGHRNLLGEQSRRNVGSEESFGETSSNERSIHSAVKMIKSCFNLHCALCKSRLALRGGHALRHHVLRYHLKQSLYYCPYCDFVAETAISRVKNHLATQHEDKEQEVWSLEKALDGEFTALRQQCFGSRSFKSLSREHRGRRRNVKEVTPDELEKLIQMRSQAQLSLHLKSSTESSNPSSISSQSNRSSVDQEYYPLNGSRSKAARSRKRRSASSSEGSIELLGPSSFRVLETKRQKLHKIKKKRKEYPGKMKTTALSLCKLKRPSDNLGIPRELAKLQESLADGQIIQPNLHGRARRPINRLDYSQIDKASDTEDSDANSSHIKASVVPSKNASRDSHEWSDRSSSEKSCDNGSTGKRATADDYSSLESHDSGKDKRKRARLTQLLETAANLGTKDGKRNSVLRWNNKSAHVKQSSEKRRGTYWRGNVRTRNHALPIAESSEQSMKPQKCPGSRKTREGVLNKVPGILESKEDLKWQTEQLKKTKNPSERRMMGNKCHMCLKIVISNHKRHVLVNHLRTKVLFCIYCKEYSCTGDESAIRSHIRNIHRGEPLNFRDERPNFEEIILKLLRRCFPLVGMDTSRNQFTSASCKSNGSHLKAPKAPGLQSKLKHPCSRFGHSIKIPQRVAKSSKQMCNVCNKLVHRWQTNHHILESHLKIPLYFCSNCEFRSAHMVATANHARLVHPNCKKDIRSKRPEHEQEFIEWRKRCFSDVKTPDENMKKAARIANADPLTDGPSSSNSRSKWQFNKFYKVAKLKVAEKESLSPNNNESFSAAPEEVGIKLWSCRLCKNGAVIPAEEKQKHVLSRHIIKDTVFCELCPYKNRGDVSLCLDHVTIIHGKSDSEKLVRSDAEQLLPEITSWGKLCFAEEEYDLGPPLPECRLCKIVLNSYDEIQNHVLMLHVKAPVLFCKQCDYSNCGDEREMFRHFSMTHPQATPNDPKDAAVPEYTWEIGEDAISELNSFRKLCFTLKESPVRKQRRRIEGPRQTIKGKATRFSPFNYALSTCRLCKKKVYTAWLRRHVLQDHLKEVLYTCGYCDYSSTVLRSAVRKHCRNAHPDQPVKLIDNQHLWVSKIADLMNECFPNDDQDSGSLTPRRTTGDFLGLFGSLSPQKTNPDDSEVSDAAKRKLKMRCRCTWCPPERGRKEFYNTQSLRQEHVMQEHYKEKVYGCELCAFRDCYRKMNVRVHIRQCHPKQKVGIVDKFPKHKAKIEKMINDCFGKKRKTLKNSALNKLKLFARQMKDNEDKKETETKDESKYCNICKRPVSLDNVERHVYQIHLKEKCVKCPYCDFAVFYDKEQVEFHVQLIHPEKIVSIKDEQEAFKDRVEEIKNEIFNSEAP